MKKIYMNPTMKVVRIKCCKMLTASTLGFGNSRTTAADADAREFDDYDDFDE